MPAQPQRRRPTSSAAARSAAFGRLDEAAMRSRTQAVLDRLSLKIDPDALAESLSAAHRQLLQVARALAFDCRILVLDEPTTALTDAEADHLFDVLRELKKGGTTILYVSHRLPEVFRLCDRITVLRDGAFVGTFTTRRGDTRMTSSRRWWEETCRRAQSTSRGLGEARSAKSDVGDPRLSANRSPSRTSATSA